MTIQPKPARLWLDIETTHLDEWTGSIIEIAAIVADHNHTPLATWESVVEPDAGCTWSDWALQHHSASGLHTACQMGRPLGVVLADLDLWLGSALQGETPPLAGYSVHFDRRWLSIHAKTLGLPDILRHCSHRHYDVTTLLAEAQETEPDVYAAVCAPDDPRPHRALADCRHALHTARLLRLMRRVPR
jgi:oligoribonuclease (3'-5' exoribonuclease)